MKSKLYVWVQTVIEFEKKIERADHEVFFFIASVIYPYREYIGGTPRPLTNLTIMLFFRHFNLHFLSNRFRNQYKQWKRTGPKLGRCY